MADKGAKKKKRSKTAAQPSVLGSLSGQRPQRLGGRREAPAAAARPKAVPAARRPSATAAAKPRPAPQKRARPTPPSPPPPRRHVSPPRGTELVTTAIQAAGELAQIGLTVGGQVIKRAVDRLPKP
jgi:hypothetical protein